MKSSKLLARAAVAVAALVVAPQAQALTFVFNNIGGAGADTTAGQGFRIAANYWSSVLTDNVTMNLNIGFQSLGANILGQTRSASSLVSINQVYNAMALDATSALDASAVASLQAMRNPTGGLNLTSGITGSVSAITNAFNADGTGYVDTATRLDNDQSVNNDALSITKASAKALGLTRDVNNAAINYNSADAQVVFSSDLPFDFNPTDGITAGMSDFIGVAIHEIGHALGFISGVDTYDFYTAPGDSDPIVRDAKGNPVPTALENFVVMSQLDLFRYGAANQLNWSTQGTPYFSIDGGATQLFGNSQFSTGQENGDGWQASHWKAPTNAAGQNVCQPFIGVMNPYLCDGRQGVVTAKDLAAMDAIGWNVNFNVLANSGYNFSSAQAYMQRPPVPEPATWAMMIAGFGLVGASMRRRNVAVRFPA